MMVNIADYAGGLGSQLPPPSGGGGGGGITKSQYIASTVTSGQVIPPGGALLAFNNLVDDTALGVSCYDGGLALVPPDALNPGSFFNLDDVGEGLYVASMYLQGVPAGATKGQLSTALVWQDDSGASIASEDTQRIDDLSAGTDTPAMLVITPPLWLTGKPFSFPAAFSIYHVSVVWTPDDGISNFNLIPGDTFCTFRIQRLALP
jgi:hypothetical protein